eukprot:RCo035221
MRMHCRLWGLIALVALGVSQASLVAMGLLRGNHHEPFPLALPCDLSVSGFSGNNFALNGLFVLGEDGLYLGRPYYTSLAGRSYTRELWYDPILGWTISQSRNSTDLVDANNAQDVDTPEQLTGPWMVWQNSELTADPAVR